MTDEEKKQLVDAVITQLKSEGTDVSNANIVSNANGIDYVVAYGKNGQIVRAVPTAISSEKVGASGYMNAYTEAGVYNINTSGGEDLPIDNQGAISARLTVLVTESGGNKVITQVLNLNNNAGGEGNVYIRSCQNGEWKAWGKLQTNVEVGVVNQEQLDALVDNGIYSGILSTTGETFIIICINNYAIAQQVGVHHISHLKYSLVAVTGEVKIEKRTRDAYGFWTEWETIKGGSDVDVAAIYTAIANEKTRAQQAEQTLDDKITAEIEKIKDGNTIVGQAREIHSRNGKTVTDSFLARTTAGSGTIGDGVASLKSVGGNIVKNLTGELYNQASGGIKVQEVRDWLYLVSKTLVGQGYCYQYITGLFDTHKYYMCYHIYSTITCTPAVSLGTGYNADRMQYMSKINANEWSLLSKIMTFKKGSISVLESNTVYPFGTESTSKDTYCYMSKPLIIDLTEMFGAGNEPDKATCDRLFGTMDALPQGLNFAKPTTFTSTGFNQFNPDNVLEGKAIVDNAIVSGDKKIAVITCLPCKVGTGENNGYCIHGGFGEDIKVYLTPLNPMEVDGELYMHELAKDATTDTYVPLIKGYMLVEVPTTANLCAHFLWSEDKCERDSYEPYHESKVGLPVIPQISEWGLAGIQTGGTLACDEIDFERGVYVKRIGVLDVNFFKEGNIANVTPKGALVFEMTKAPVGVNNHISNSDYRRATPADVYNAKEDKLIYIGKSGWFNANLTCVVLYDAACKSKNDVINAFADVKIYYELAEPIEYPLPKVDNNYISSDYGVEQFDGVVPCNANNLYYMRSLAGETRNFLDRMYDNTAKTDAKEVADYITNNLADKIPQATLENKGLMSVEDKIAIDRLNGAKYHVEKNFPAHNKGHLITFNVLAGQTIIINITISEIVDRAIYYKLFLGDEEYNSFTQPANYNTITRTIVAEKTGEYHIYRNYTVQSTFITTISVEVLSEAHSLSSEGPFVEVATINPKCNSYSGFSLKNCVTNSQQPLQLTMSRVGSGNPDIRQSITLNPGSYQVFVTGKFLSISGEIISCGVSNTVGLPYISIPVEAGKEFSMVSYPVHITEDKSGIFYFSLSGTTDGELAVVELYALGIARVDSSYITPSMIAELTEGKKHSFGIDSRIKSGFFGRKWVTLGDSITSQASYQGIVKDELQLGSVVNLGVGGKPISGNGTNSMCQDSYLSQIPSDAGIITIMGGTNDFAQSKELGDFGSTDTTKFCGALNHIIDYITENYPTAMLVVLGTPLGINWGAFPETDGLLNGIGLSTLDYGIAAEEVCRRRGVHYISMASCGWSTKNISQFVKNDGADGYGAAYFHPNEKGGRRIAAVIVGGLRRIEPVMQYYI